MASHIDDDHDAADISHLGVFYEGDESELEEPIFRVFFLFKILLINLSVGFVFTVICLSARRPLGKCLSYIFCGLCDDCDCDYDGSYPSRSSQPPRKCKARNVKNRVYADENDTTVLFAFWVICRAFFSNKKLVKMTLFLFVGMISRYLLSSAFDDTDGLSKVETLTPIHSFSNHTVLMEDDNPERVFFVTPTSASGIQNGRLIRIAQAIYPSRDYVTWVIVSADPVRNYLWYSYKTEHWTPEQIKMWKQEESRIIAHLDDIHQTVSRFGIPFVILSAHEIHHRNSKFLRIQLKTRQSISTYMKASQIGLSWVVKTFNSGVLLCGPDDTVYNFNLFQEVQRTKLMSSWPTAFDPRYSFSLSMPLLQSGNNGTITNGYFVGGVVKILEIPLQYASYAINIKVAKRLQASNALWKLTVDSTYSSTDLGLETYHVQPLAKNCSEIYVWKISIAFTHVRIINKQIIPLKFKWLNTNVEKLHKLINRWFAIDMEESGI